MLQLKLVVFGLNFTPERTGIGRYSGELAAWLSNRGHRVEAIVGLPHYPEWRVYVGYRVKTLHTETLEGVQVHRVHHFVPDTGKVTTQARLRMQLSFAARAARYWIPLLLASNKPDLVMAIAPPLIPALYPALYRLRDVPWLLHLQDLEFDIALRLRMFARPLAGAGLRALERLLLRSATAVSTITEAMRRRVIAKGVPENRTFVLPNWSDTQRIRPLPRDNAFRAELGLSTDHIVVLYAGAFGVKHGVDLLVQAADRLRGCSNLRFLLVGDGADRARVERMVHELSLANVHLLPVQPEDRLPELLAAGDIHVVLQKRDAADLVMPSKVGNILAAGRACIATADPGTTLHDIIAGHRLGLVCAPEDPEALSESIERLALDSELREACGRRARAYAEQHLDRDRILTAFEERLLAMARKRSAERR